MGLPVAYHKALAAGYFMQDLSRSQRVIGQFRRNHVRSLTAALATRPEGKIVPVPVLDEPDPERIEREFIREKRPVVLKGAAKDWPAAQKWSFDFFKEHYGSSQVTTPQETFSRTKEGTGYQISLANYTMREFVDAVKAGSSAYLKFFPVFKLHPELLEDLDMAAMKRWSGGRVAKSALDNEFYMGGPNTTTHLHTERSDIFHACFAGKKRWRLYSPDQSLYLYPIPSRTLYVASEVDFLAPDYEVHPWFRYANGYETVLEPGDVLYLPAYTWHAVHNAEATISANLLWYDKWRAIAAMPMHWMNSEFWARRSGGTIESFLNVFNNRLLRSIHS